MKLTLEALSKRYQSLKDRFTLLEKDVRSLKDLLNVHDNWNATVRKLIGSKVNVCSRSGALQSGTLKWSDRYNLSIRIEENGKVVDRVYTKGGIDWIEPAN